MSAQRQDQTRFIAPDTPQEVRERLDREGRTSVFDPTLGIEVPRPQHAATPLARLPDVVLVAGALSLFAGCFAILAQPA